MTRKVYDRLINAKFTIVTLNDGTLGWLGIAGRFRVARVVVSTHGQRTVATIDITARTTSGIVAQVSQGS